MQHEKVNKISGLFCSSMASSRNSHNINRLHSGKFADVNLTQSKLAKSLHFKIGTKIIKKLNTNKLNYKIMAKYVILMNGIVKHSSNSFESAKKCYDSLCQKNPKSNVVFHF